MGVMGLPTFRWPWQTERARERLQQQLAGGRRLEDAPKRTIVPEFEALTLSQALDVEITKARGDGMDKIRLDMDVHSAAELAAFLRRAALR